MQVVAVEAGEMVKILKGLELLSEEMGTFWQSESDKFTTHGQKMIANETHYAKIKPLMKAAAKKDMPFWTQAKNDFSEYAYVLTQIMMSDNFTTDAKPPPTQEIKCGKLDFVLHIPAAVDVKKIMAD